MNNPETNRCYLVRTIPDLVEQSIVGVGWSDFDFSAMKNAEEAIGAIRSSYGIRHYANQVRRFFAIEEGDLIVASLPYSVAIGRASGGLFHDPSHLKIDRSNQRRVVFPKDGQGKVVRLPRVAFSEAFQRRLRVQGITVNDLGEFRDELIKAWDDVTAGKDYSWSLVMAEKVEKASSEFKTNLLQRIRSGRTNLPTGGAGLEHLVKELLQTEGYTAEVLSTRAFPGFADADVKASRTDPCATVNLLVQIKHHQGFTNEHGLTQLEEIRKQDLTSYSDYKLIFCTSAETSEAFDARAEASGITVIDGTELVEWIALRMDRLSADTKIRLGICEVPTVI